MRRRNGFIQKAILYLLQEEPMHGYQIMKELEKRSNGVYTASAGAIYPALQELLDRNLLKLDNSTDKKIYSLNENGRRKIEEVMKEDNGDFWTEWEEKIRWKNCEEFKKLRKALDLFEKEFRKSVHEARSNGESIEPYIAFIGEMTAKLKMNQVK